MELALQAEIAGACEKWAVRSERSEVDGVVGSRRSRATAQHVDSDVLVWCEVFEGGVHDGTQVDTAEVAGEGAEGVLRVRIVDVEAGLAEHRDFDADGSHFFG
jgi:hypothetical protein